MPSTSSFLFDELKDQAIHEKVIKVKRQEDIIALINIRCQLIQDVQAFALSWKSELITRKEQIDRMIQKINCGGDPNDVAFQSLMSQSNRLATETVYEIPYKI